MSRKVLVHESFEFGGFCTWPSLAVHHRINQNSHLNKCKNIYIYIYIYIYCICPETIRRYINDDRVVILSMIGWWSTKNRDMKWHHHQANTWAKMSISVELYRHRANIEKISNKSRYSIGQGIGRKFKSEKMSPRSWGHCKNPKWCLHRAKVIARIQNDVSIESRSLEECRRMSPQSWGHCKNAEGCLHRAEVIARCLHKVEVIAGIQKDVSTKPRSL